MGHGGDSGWFGPPRVGTQCQPWALHGEQPSWLSRKPGFQPGIPLDRGRVACCWLGDCEADGPDGTGLAFGSKPIGAVEAFFRQWIAFAEELAEQAAAFKGAAHHSIVVEAAGEVLGCLNGLGGVHETRI